MITALYERLSRDDEQLGESNSITNQKIYLENYAQEHGFTNCQHYTDDGYSGGNFERPGWKQLIADIEAGKVASVLAKDMSRIGRNYLQTGFYTDVLFRQKHVRFIAINNGIDNSNPSSGEFAPFLNVMNEWYLRDQSTAGSRDDSKRYRDCKELTDEMIQAFVEKIMVHPATKDAHGKRQREIEIYLKFIGNPATFHSPTE